MPLIEMNNAATVAVDIAAWAVIHAATGYLAHRMSARRFDHDTWMSRGRTFERQGRLYDRVSIKRWKDRLPEAGALFDGGVSKRHLRSFDLVGLQSFAIETRRAEFAHRLCGAFGPLFFVWNRPLIGAVMTVYGVAVNLPFVMIQRYNRLRVQRLINRRSSTSSASSRSADWPT